MLKYSLVFVAWVSSFLGVSVAVSGSEVLGVGCLVGNDSESLSVVATEVSRQNLFQSVWSGHARMSMG